MKRINIHEEYKKIASKLQKKLFQKVPYKEVSEGFASLCQNLQREGQLQYTALVMLSAAKAELEEAQQSNQSQGNSASIFGFGMGKTKGADNKSAGEQKGHFILGGNFFVNSGRVFATSTLHDKVEFQYFAGEEFAIEAIQCFQQAIDVYEANKEFGVCEALSFEIAGTLKLLEKFHESGRFFMKCNQFAKETQHKTLQIEALKQTYLCQVEIADYEQATESLHQIISVCQEYIMEKEAFERAKNLNLSPIIVSTLENIVEASVNLALVLLIQKHAKDATHVLESIPPVKPDYRTVLLIYLQHNVIPLLKELIDCCIAEDINSIRYLIENELKFGAGLSSLQKRLLYIVQHVNENPLYLEYSHSYSKQEDLSMTSPTTS